LFLGGTTRKTNNNLITVVSETSKKKAWETNYHIAESLRCRLRKEFLQLLV